MASTSKAALLVLTLSGCGGAAAGAAAPPPPAEPPAEPSGDGTLDALGGMPAEATVDEAALAFERAEGELDALLVAEAEPAEGADDGADEERVGKRATVPAPRPAQPRILEQSEDQAATACSRACRALDSMTRSSDRLCSLTGEDDPRCENVRERLSRAEQAVRQRCRLCEG